MSDEELREDERLARTGDQDAARRWFEARKRRGATVMLVHQSHEAAVASSPKGLPGPPVPWAVLENLAGQAHAGQVGVDVAWFIAVETVAELLEIAKLVGDNVTVERQHWVGRVVGLEIGHSE